eukprot:m.105521 g.105521  ORF g.105521 m.105521 type:complete len:430 (+) comp27656_c0_seq1:104-1393(+)
MASKEQKIDDEMADTTVPQDDGDNDMDEEDAMMLDQGDVMEVIDTGNAVDELQHGMETHANITLESTLTADALAEHNEDRMEDNTIQEAPEDCSSSKFIGHTGYVLSIAWHPQGNVVASGGEDDKAFAWNVADGSKILEVTDHKDSVVQVTFNRAGTLLATASMDGMIVVRKFPEGDKVCELDCGDDLTWIQWHPIAQFIIAGTDSGSVYMWDVPGANMSFFSGHGTSVTCGAWSPEGRNFISGADDGVLILWSPKTRAAITKIDVKTDHKFHKAGVTCLAWSSTGELVATGAQDGTVCITQPKLGKVTFSLQIGPQSIEAIAFSNTQPLTLAIADLGGMLYIYDENSQRLLHKFQHDDGIVKLEWEKTRAHLLCCTLDGKINLWNCNTGRREKVWTGHVGQVLDFAISPDGNHIVSAGQDSKSLVYTI